MRRFSASELNQHLTQCEAQGREHPLLLDVREPWEFEKCQLKGSILIPMRQIPDALDDLDPNKEIVVICHHGIRSRQVAYYLEQQGFDKLINLEGGVESWAREVDPKMDRY